MAIFSALKDVFRQSNYEIQIIPNKLVKNRCGRVNFPSHKAHFPQEKVKNVSQSYCDCGGHFGFCISQVYSWAFFSLYDFKISDTSSDYKYRPIQAPNRP